MYTLEHKEIGSLKNYPEGYDPNEYDYGVIEVTDFVEKTKTTYKVCIRLGHVRKYNSATKQTYSEIQFIYRDDDFKTHCLCLDITSSDRYSINIIYKGQMAIQL